MTSLKRNILLAITCTSVSLLSFHENRNFYSFDSGRKNITVWKRLGGKCFIISGKYYALFTPSDDYVETLNRNAVTIVSDPNAPFDFVIANDYGSPVNIHSSGNRFKYYSYEDKPIFAQKYYVKNKFMDTAMEYLSIDIKENLVIKNGKKIR